MAWLAAKCPVSGDIDAIQVDLSDDPDIPDMGPRVPVASQFSGAAGHFQQDGGVPVVAFRRRQLRHPVALTATLAHELAHARLLTERRVDAARKDHEQLTNLATVFFGLGVFTANAAFDFSKSQYGWQTHHASVTSARNCSGTRSRTTRTSVARRGKTRIRSG